MNMKCVFYSIAGTLAIVAVLVGFTWLVVIWSNWCDDHHLPVWVTLSPWGTMLVVSIFCGLYSACRKHHGTV